MTYSTLARPRDVTNNSSQRVNDYVLPNASCVTPSAVVAPATECERLRTSGNNNDVITTTTSVLNSTALEFVPLSVTVPNVTVESIGENVVTTTRINATSNDVLAPESTLSSTNDDCLLSTVGYDDRPIVDVSASTPTHLRVAVCVSDYADPLDGVDHVLEVNQHDVLASMPTQLRAAVCDNNDDLCLDGVARCADVEQENDVVGNTPVQAEAIPKVMSASRGQGGLILNGQVDGVGVRFLVDTGAEPTVISLEFLQKLPKKLRTLFQDSMSRLHNADGSDLRAQGPVLCQVTVGGRTVTDAVYAAPIAGVEAILGLDTLRELGLELNVGGVNVLSGASVPVIRRLRVPQIRRVSAAEDVVIPARSEAIVPGSVKGGQHSEHFLMIGQRSKPTSNSLFVARTLIAECQSTCAVRVMNPADEPRHIWKGEVLAEAEEVTLVSGDTVTEPRQPYASAEKNVCRLVSNSDEERLQVPEHLRQLYQDTCEREQLADDVRRDLRQLLNKHADVFASSDMDLGRTNIVLHDIDTGNARPIRQPPRRVPTALQPELDKEIADMLRKGVIEQGQSPWASPVVLVRKKDGSLRFCVDYRRINAVTEFDAYPLPRIDETLEALSGARFFTTLDLISGYWQVGLTPEARLKSAFCVRSGLYLWNVMPFGLCNAPGTFERLMETVLHNLQWQICLVYLDDVVIYGGSEQQLMDRMDMVFTRLRAANLKLKPKKCRLFARRTDYLGHVISEEGISVSPDKVGAIRDWPVPEDVTDLRSFLGTANYYRRFVKDFATIATPLHRLTDKGAEFEWRYEHQDAFEQLKNALCVAPTLAFPVADAPFVLDTDASLSGMGAVLSQVVDGVERVLGYASKSFSKAERNYCVTRRELLAVVFFVKHFRPYLYGRNFTVRTDHSSLRWLMNFKEPEGQLARWLQVLYEYRFDIVHRPGKQHGNADGLSRQPCKQCKRTDEVDDRPAVRLIALQPAWTNDELAKLQSADIGLAKVHAAVKANVKPSVNDITAWSNAEKQLWQDWDRLRLIENVLRRAWFDTDGSEVSTQLLVPRRLVPELLAAAHDDQLAGHFAHRRTLLRLRPSYYWVGMSGDVRQWCRTCDVCNGRRPAPTRPHHALQQDPVSEPLQRVAVDILGPLDPVTTKGNRYVLVVVDYLTKWGEAYAIPNQTAETVARVIVDEFVCRYGMPEQLHSDQGRQFESELFTQMCSLLGIKKTRTTPLHPQSDGQTERMNRTLLDILAKLTQEHDKEWDVMLPFAMAAYRSSVHSTTEETPNRLMLGREVTTPMTLLAPSPPNAQPQHPWIKQIHERFESGYRAVLETTEQAHRTQKAVYDRRARSFHFEVGDKVWLYDPKPHKGKPHKLDAERWAGPYVVRRRISAAVYLVMQEGQRKGRVINVDRLAPYVTRPEHLQIQVNPIDELPIDATTNVNEFNDDENSHVSRDVADQLLASDLAPVHVRRDPAPVTTRAQRQRRRPERFNDCFV